MSRARGPHVPRRFLESLFVGVDVKRVALTLVAVALVSVGIFALSRFLLTSPAERSARGDVDTLSSAVADYVAETGRLPRITVTPGLSGGGDTIWGAEFLVESRTLPRADASRARIFFLVGDAQSWCVEALYTPPSLFSDSSGEWVKTLGERGDVGRIVDGRCGDDYLLVLSPVEATNVPEPGSVIVAASAPVGTCFANPFSADAAVRPRHIDVVACTTGHFGEVFLTGEGTESDFGAYEEAAAGSCASASMAFVGVPRNISSFAAEPFTVDEAAWRSGAREFSCFVFLPTEDYPLVGSAGDSWR